MLKKNMRKSYAALKRKLPKGFTTTLSPLWSYVAVEPCLKKHLEHLKNGNHIYL